MDQKPVIHSQACDTIDTVPGTSEMQTNCHKQLIRPV